VKPLIQKLPLTQQTSFVARTYTTPHYETTWHQHDEVELIIQLKGAGMCFIGNYIGDFKEGDIFLLGPNLPHEFKKEADAMKCSVMVVHFHADFWGADFWKMPETGEIKQLLQKSLSAIKISAGQNSGLGASIQKLETVTGFERISLLCQCRLGISRHTGSQTLSTLTAADFSPFADDKINRLFEYTINRFKEPIALSTVAAIANMSISAFCRYFKRNTKKTYVEFVNEMRIGHACHSLLSTDKTVLQICYDSGFNTVANFNKQFLKVKGTRPLVYRKNSGYKGLTQNGR
jgi:AraC-like DNA-binding protein